MRRAQQLGLVTGQESCQARVARPRLRTSRQRRRRRARQGRTRDATRVLGRRRRPLVRRLARRHHNPYHYSGGYQTQSCMVCSNITRSDTTRFVGCITCAALEESARVMQNDCVHIGALPTNVYTNVCVCARAGCPRSQRAPERRSSVRATAPSGVCACTSGPRCGLRTYGCSTDRSRSGTSRQRKTQHWRMMLQRTWYMAGRAQCDTHTHTHTRTHTHTHTKHRMLCAYVCFVLSSRCVVSGTICVRSGAKLNFPDVFKPLTAEEGRHTRIETLSIACLVNTYPTRLPHRGLFQARSLK